VCTYRKSANIAYELFGLLCFEDELSEREGIPLKGKMGRPRRKSGTELNVDALLRVDEVTSFAQILAVCSA